VICAAALIGAPALTNGNIIVCVKVVVDVKLRAVVTVAVAVGVRETTPDSETAGVLGRAGVLLSAPVGGRVRVAVAAAVPVRVAVRVGDALGGVLLFVGLGLFVAGGGAGVPEATVGVEDFAGVAPAAFGVADLDAVAVGPAVDVTTCVGVMTFDPVHALAAGKPRWPGEAM
jgi:hypothetical protein